MSDSRQCETRTETEKVGLLTISDRRLLLVRKQVGPWILPGGKPETSDSGDVATLARELHEELCCSLLQPTVRYVGEIVGPISDRSADTVRVRLYRAELLGSPVRQTKSSRFGGSTRSVTTRAP